MAWVKISSRAPRKDAVVTRAVEGGQDSLAEALWPATSQHHNLFAARRPAKSGGRRLS